MKLEIYFGDMTVEVIETKPSYLALDLISDLGGQAGLWVGVSMIALFEVIELIMDICILCAQRYRVFLSFYISIYYIPNFFSFVLLQCS